MTTRAGGDRLFAYGTLMLAAVRDAVCGRHLAGRAAQLADYARYALAGEVYPGLVPEARALTRGLLLDGLDGTLWRRLDAWESPLYQRITVEVQCADGAARAAQAYVLAPVHRHRLDGSDWSPEEFARLHLAAYVARWGGAA